jgi:hypothetical protein
VNCQRRGPSQIINQVKVPIQHNAPIREPRQRDLESPGADRIGSGTTAKPYAPHRRLPLDGGPANDRIGSGTTPSCATRQRQAASTQPAALAGTNPAIRLSKMTAHKRAAITSSVPCPSGFPKRLDRFY